MAKAADVYFQVDPWKVIEQGFDPAYARVSESIFSLGNESIGVRGCFDEGGHVDSLRGAYTNGIYDMEKLSRSYKGIIGGMADDDDFRRWRNARFGAVAVF